MPEYQLIALCGYDYDSVNLLSSLHPFIILLYDFQEDDFFSGNVRRLDFDFSTRAQIEAIATHNALDYYITNEQTPISIMDSIIDIPAALQRLDLREFLLPYLSRFGVVENPDALPTVYNLQADIHIYPNPASDIIYMDFPQEFFGAEYEILNLKGQKVAKGVLKEHVIFLENRKMPVGQYVLTVRKDRSLKSIMFIKND